MTSLMLALAIAQCPGGVCPAQPTAYVATTATPNHGSYSQIVVKIGNQIGSTTYFGSGVILRRSGLVLTCKHIFGQGLGNITVCRADGSCWRARFLAADSRDDLAAVVISDPGPVPEVWYALEHPRVATLVGFPGLSTTPVETTTRYELAQSVIYDRPAAQGVSGGPLFCRGRLALAGVLWGTDARSCAVTSIHDVRRFLMQPACFGFFGGERAGGFGNRRNIRIFSGGNDYEGAPVAPLAFAAAPIAPITYAAPAVLAPAATPLVIPSAQAVVQQPQIGPVALSPDQFAGPPVQPGAVQLPVGPSPQAGLPTAVLANPFAVNPSVRAALDGEIQIILPIHWRAQ